MKEVCSSNEIMSGECKMLKEKMYEVFEEISETSEEKVRNIICSHENFRISFAPRIDTVECVLEQDEYAIGLRFSVTEGIGKYQKFTSEALNSIINSDCNYIERFVKICKLICGENCRLSDGIEYGGIYNGPHIKKLDEDNGFNVDSYSYVYGDVNVTTVILKDESRELKYSLEILERMRNALL